MKMTDEVLDRNSCLNKAEPDEYLFVLRAKDPCAVPVILYWTYLRCAMQINHSEDAKIKEALKCADHMREQYRTRFSPDAEAKR